jgi:hypothetical protein
MQLSVLAGEMAPLAAGSPYWGGLVWLAMAILLIVIGFLWAYLHFERRLSRLLRETQLSPVSPARIDGGTRLDVSASNPPSPAMSCPACHREYGPSMRYCLRDSQTLVRSGDSHATGPAAVPLGACLSGEAKICPSCAARYDLDATFCGNDSAELVAVN